VYTGIWLHLKSALFVCVCVCVYVYVRGGYMGVCLIHTYTHIVPVECERRVHDEGIEPRYRGLDYSRRGPYVMWVLGEGERGVVFNTHKA
jgi:hypothetical protein